MRAEQLHVVYPLSAVIHPWIRRCLLNRTPRIYYIQACTSRKTDRSLQGLFPPVPAFIEQNGPSDMEFVQGLG